MKEARIDWSILFLSLAFGLAAIFVIWYGLWAKANQMSGVGRTIGVGILLIAAAIIAALIGTGRLVGTQQPANVSEQPITMVVDTPTPEYLAGYEIAPVSEPTAVGHLPIFRYATPEKIVTLPSYPIPSPTFVATPDKTTETPDTSAVVRLVIPALQVDAEVKYVPYDDGDKTWLITGLRQEIAWLGGTSWPGLGSNTALAGHVTVRDYGNGPFRYLDKLAAGDEITLYTEQNVYTYRVREQTVVTQNDLWVTQPTQSSQLTLITCTDWSKESQIYLKRLVVFADLVKVEAQAQMGSN
jgi:LPXTG-site transpeptidase (sortase) family protein